MTQPATEWAGERLADFDHGSELTGDGALARVGARLTQYCGLAFASHNLPDLVRAVERAARHFDLGSPDALAHAVEEPGASHVLQFLVGLLTIRESYFFRLKEHFSLLREHVVPEIMRRRRASGSSDRTLRAWSAGCACGEEAYSIGMVLREAAPDPSWTIEVLGTDINAEFLAQAAKAEYTTWSLRGVSDIQRLRYFEPAPRGRFRVRREVRESVRFAALNLVALDASPAVPAGQDVVFCRNVFIYFDPAVVAHVAPRVATSLHDCGYVFFGPSDPVPARLSGLARVAARATTMVYRRAPEVRETPAPSVRRRHASARGRALQVPRPAAPLPQVPHAADRAHAAAEARACAGRGAWVEAEHWALHWLSLEPGSAPAHYLLGTLCGVGGRPHDAARSFRRALYLDPSFALASFALSEVLAAEGRAAQARGCLVNAVQALEARAPHDVLDGSDEITADWLRRVIAARLHGERESP